MYCRHFSLKKKPFQLSSDNYFLWLGKTHARALDDLKECIEGPDKLLVLTGDVGTGKTTLIHEIIQTLSPDTACAHITDPSLELHYLFLAIAKGLGFEHLYQAGEKFAPILTSFLERAQGQGQKAAIIIDEVHLIPDRFLEQLISWSRFSPGHVLTIILAGQLEFHDVIAKSLGRSWKNHVDIHAMLYPLDEKETHTYINQRLAFAGARRKIFIVPAVHQAYLFSKGIPRLINIACDQAMIAAFSKDMKIIDALTFQEAVGTLELPHAPEPSSQKKTTKPLEDKSVRPGKILAGLAAAVVLGIFTYYFYPSLSPETTSPIAAPLPESVPEAAQPMLVFQPVPIPESNNETVQLETAARLPIPSDTPPIIQPVNEKPLGDNAQAEFYSPPEEEKLAWDTGDSAPPEPVPVFQPVPKPESNNETVQLETAARLPIPSDIPPIIEPANEKPLGNDAQAEFYSPPEEEKLAWDTGDSAPPEPVPMFQPVPKPESNNETVQLETTARLPIPSDIPPIIEPANEKPLGNDAQAEFYSPPEEEKLAWDTGDSAPPEPDPVDMEKFINEVFMIHAPVADKSDEPEKAEAKTAAAPSPVPVPDPQKEPAGPLHHSQRIPEHDAIIDWLIDNR